MRFLPSPVIHLVSPLKCVLNISWDDCYAQEKLKTKFLQNFGGQTSWETRKWQILQYISTRACVVNFND